MPQIAILSTDEGLVDLLRPSGLKAARIGSSEFSSLQHGGEAPQALVVDARRREKLPDGVAAFRRKHPDTGIVIVMSSLEPRLMLEAMRAGVTECIAEPLTPPAFDEAVRRVLTNAPAAASGLVYAFIGAKGGVGTTTIAVNTAAAIGGLARADVLMMDMHLGHGDGAVFLGVEPRFSVVDALDNIQRVDQTFLVGVVEKTKVGIHLLASSARPPGTPLDARRIRTLLDAAAQAYRTTVLDVPRSDATMLDALDAAAAIVVVTSQELASLRSAIHMTETLRHRYGAGRIKVVINRFQQESAVPSVDIERAIGATIHHTFPSDYRAAVDAQNAGRPVVLDTDKRLAKSLKAFAKDLAGIGKDRVERPAGVLARLAWRRA